MSEHTPGPWGTIGLCDLNDEYESLCVGSKEGGIAEMLLRSPAQRRSAAADARLIAAAPEMLDALTLAADVLMSHDGGNPKGATGWKSDEMLEAWLKVRNAIAKATGAQSSADGQK